MAQGALARLKIPEVKMKDFPELHDGDLKAFDIKQLGESRKAPSWVWGDFGFVNSQTDLKDYMIEGEKCLPGSHSSYPDRVK